MKIYDTGEILGSLIFIEEVENGSNNRRMALFKCPLCDKEFITGIAETNSRKTKSCGCHIHADHIGIAKTSLYAKWSAIKQRCNNTDSWSYRWYGARGIKISDEFYDFFVFKKYVSSLPNFDKIKELKLTLDRIDNNSHYQRGNLRWVTMAIQATNKRKQIHIRK